MRSRVLYQNEFWPFNFIPARHVVWGMSHVRETNVSKLLWQPLLKLKYRGCLSALCSSCLSRVRFSTGPHMSEFILFDVLFYTQSPLPRMS